MLMTEDRAVLVVVAIDFLRARLWQREALLHKSLEGFIS